MERLYEILDELRPDVDFRNEKALITNGILDSFDVMALVAELSDEYDIRIKPAEMTPENFNSAESIMAMVERLEDE